EDDNNATDRGERFTAHRLLLSRTGLRTKGWMNQESRPTWFTDHPHGVEVNSIMFKLAVLSHQPSALSLIRIRPQFPIVSDTRPDAGQAFGFKDQERNDRQAENDV